MLLYSCPADFTWAKLVTVLNGMGYKERTGGKTGGSRRDFWHPDTGHVIKLHKPHLGAILKRYQLRLVIVELGVDK